MSAGILLAIVFAVEPVEAPRLATVVGNPNNSTCDQQLTYKGLAATAPGFHGVTFETQADLHATVAMRIQRATAPHEFPFNC